MEVLVVTGVTLTGPHSVAALIAIGFVVIYSASILSWCKRASAPFTM